MNKTLKVIKYEYTRHVFEKRFLFSLLSLPLAVIAMVIIAVAIALFSVDRAPIGYIDRSGFFAEAAPLEIKGNLFDPAIDFIPYFDINQAQSALEANSIQAYYVIPETFPKSRQVELFFLKTPSEQAQGQFVQWTRQNMDTYQTMDPLILERLQKGSVFTMVSLDDSREMRQDQWLLIVLPFVAGVTFIIVVLTSGGYLLQAVVEEKENRTMEIVVTSVTPTQLMAGKIIGNISVGLTQLAVWLAFTWIGLRVAGRFWPALREISIPGQTVAVTVLLFLPAFVMIAAIMSTIGAVMTEMREAQQISGIFSILVTIPFYATTPIMFKPNGTLAIILSLFPLSAPITLMLRMALTTVPIWQIVLIILVLIAVAILSIVLAGRAFRMGMLQYGKRLSLKELLKSQEAV